MLRPWHSKDGPQLNILRPRRPTHLLSCADSCQGDIDLEVQELPLLSSSIANLNENSDPEIPSDSILVMPLKAIWFQKDPKERETKRR